MRRSHLFRLGLVVLAAVAATTAFTVVVRAHEGAPLVTIKDVMNGCNHKKYGLFGLIQASLKLPECTAEDWKVIAARAALMAEAGQSLKMLTPPRGGDDDAGITKWKAHAQAYSDAAKALKSAAVVKNKDDANKAIATLTERCDKCHADHQNE